MKLYQDHKVNPFASCLPLLAQIPVFIALFYLLQDDLRNEICPELQAGGRDVPCGESKASEFLFIPDITDNATGGILILLIVLYVGSQLASSLLMSVSADKNQRMIFLALPFIFIPFIISFPAGLLVYWITTNLWTIVQQFIVRRTVGPVQPPMQPGAKRDDDNGKPKLTKSGGGPSPRPAPAAAGGGSRRASAPPPPPSKRKKKRSGRRR
jgi:YidC/Oxa1 family membrane protein insertase